MSLLCSPGVIAAEIPHGGCIPLAQAPVCLFTVVFLGAEFGLGARSKSQKDAEQIQQSQ